MHLPWRNIAPEPGGPAISTSLTENESSELARLAKDADVLEVGAAFGYSSVLMALAGAKSVTSVDPHSELESLTQLMSNAVAYGVDGIVSSYVDTSQVALPALAVAGRNFDLVFIDGDHAEAAVVHDVEWALKLLRPGGVLACHDYRECCCPGVAPALDLTLGEPTRVVDTLYVVQT